jgi:riboflavin kinase/FMN adenylyltransferase
MKIFNSSTVIPDSFKGAAIAIGNFDAIHLGHQKIIETCTSLAKKEGIKSGLITFNPHPIEVLGKEKFYFHINSFEQKIQLLKTLGLDFVYVVNFDAAFAKLTAKEFIETFLYANFFPKHIITGLNFNFGNERKGNAALLKEYQELFSYHMVELVKYKDTIISTTAIKDLLKEGRIIKANNMLGRTMTYKGTVTKGAGFAKTKLETPTANLSTDFSNQFSPLRGVYLAKTTIDGMPYYGVANLGVKPTINTSNIPLLELHIFNFDRDIYNKNIEVNLLCLIRPERTFANIDQLKAQITNDIRQANYVLRNLTRYHLYVE